MTDDKRDQRRAGSGREKDRARPRSSPARIRELKHARF